MIKKYLTLRNVDVKYLSLIPKTWKVAPAKLSRGDVDSFAEGMYYYKGADDITVYRVISCDIPDALKKMTDEEKAEMLAAQYVISVISTETANIVNTTFGLSTISDKRIAKVRDMYNNPSLKLSVEQISHIEKLSVEKVKEILAVK